VNQTLELLTVAFGDAVAPHGVAHCRDEVAADFERSVHVLDGLIRHVAGHPSARCCHDVEVVFKFIGESIDSLSKEQVVVGAVEAALFHSFQEVCGDVNCLELRKASRLEGLSDDAGAGPNVQAAGCPRQRQATLLFVFDDLVDDVVRLSEVDDTCPLVVSFGGESRVELSDVTLLRQIVVELLDDESAFFVLSLAPLGHGVSVKLPLFDFFDFAHLLVFSLVSLLNLIPN